METDIRALLLEAVLNHSEDGIASIDAQGMFNYYNQRMSEIEGLDREEVIGRYILDIYPSFNLQNSTMLEALRVGKPILNVRQRYRNHKGREIYALVSDIPVIRDGQVLGVVEFVRDIEQLRRVHEQTKELDKSDYLNKETMNRNMMTNPYRFEDFLTQNPTLSNLIENVRSLSATDANVLIYGETGTGKEMIAQSIHQASGRSGKPFIAQNCAAIPETLLESILFGTAKGSFTGAVDRTGLFEQANGGTLLLDELNSMPFHLQPKLLRVLEEGRVTRIGSHVERKIDVRVISTVNVEPTSLIEEKKLREDLFYRLCRFSVYLPPLRDRKEDILFLAESFITQQNALNGKSARLSEEVMALFRAYRWDGNVRELKNIIESACDVIKNEAEIRMEHLSSYFIEKMKKKGLIGSEDTRPPVLGYAGLVENYERQLIHEALMETNGNISRASQLLGMKRPTLQHKIKRLSVSVKI